MRRRIDDNPPGISSFGTHMTPSSEIPKPRFDSFYKYDELTKLLFEYAQAFPTLAAIRSIGKSYEGRDIWVATITNVATGSAEDKPAFWADGNIHAAELTASTASPPRTSTATARSSSCASPIRTGRGRSASRTRA